MRNKRAERVTSRKSMKVERGDKARQPSKPTEPMARYPASFRDRQKQPKGRGK